MRRVDHSDEVIIAKYQETGSAYEAGRQLNIHAGTVYRRLAKHKIGATLYHEKKYLIRLEHPTIPDEPMQQRTIHGHTGPCVKVICPYCDKARWIAYRNLKHQIKRPNFRGACRSCFSSQPKARTFRTGRNPSGRHIQKNGYVVLGKNAIANEDLDLFDEMRRGGNVFEHRWVMAKHLGRALTSKELVDHMDGGHASNALENLRLYVRGKQEPGSAPGHGTYYHEWQMALRKIELLEAQLMRWD